MKVPKHFRITAVLLAFLCLIVTIGYSSVTSEVKAAPPGDQPAPDTDPELDPNFPPLTAAVTNDRCAEAEELTPLILLPWPGQETTPPDDYSVSANDKSFHNGNNVDDWYSYTTHDLECDSTMLMVSLTSNQPQTEIEIYQYCFNWPLESSMYEETIGFGEEGTTITPLSGLDKTISIVDVLPNFTYYIHVNCLYRPDNYGSITYDLKIDEYCLPEIMSLELDTGRTLRRVD